jgi:transcriptional regulator with XRE-family HTH domain
VKPTSSSPAARTLAASLREEREARNVGLRRLADKLGVLPQVLSLWEKGQRLASVEDVSAILALLGVTGEKRDRIRTPGAARAGTQLARVEQLGPSVRAHYEAESRKHGNRHHHVVAADRSRAAADA